MDVSLHTKICLLLQHKYQIDEDIVDLYANEIESLYNEGYTPRRIVDSLAKVILDLKD